jgi:hypothetical protein
VKADMHDHTPLDNELAAFTDQVMQGSDITANPAMDELAAVVRQLHTVIAPDDPASDAFRERLRTRLSMEWDLQHPQPVQWWRSQRAQWVAAAAASIALVLAAALVISSQVGSDSDSYSGTAAFGSLVGVFVVSVIVISISALVFLYRRDR